MAEKKLITDLLQKSLHNQFILKLFCTKVLSFFSFLFFFFRSQQPHVESNQDSVSVSVHGHAMALTRITTEVGVKPQSTAERRKL